MIIQHKDRNDANALSSGALRADVFKYSSQNRINLLISFICILEKKLSLTSSLEHNRQVYQVFCCSCILLEVNVIPVSIALKQNLKKCDSKMTCCNEIGCVLK